MKKPLFCSSEEDNLHADRWMVSYADFVTLMFVLFLAMYLILPKETQHDILRVLTPIPEASALQVERATGSKDVLAVQQTNSLLAMQALRPLATEEVALRHSTEYVAIDIKETLLFDSGRATLTTEALAILQQVATVLRQYPGDVQVQGHTDNVPVQGRFASNWELSAARASAVARVLNEQGVSADRLAAVGLAAAEPRASNETREGQALNRRVSILLMTKR